MSGNDWLLANADGSEWVPTREDLEAIEERRTGGVHLWMPRGLFECLVQRGSGCPSGKLPTLCVWYEEREGVWKGVVHNRDRRCSLFRSAEELGALLIELNDALHQEPAGWRADRPARGTPEST